MQGTSRLSNEDRKWAATVSLACAALVIVLIALAVVQYRWIAEVRESERRHLELSLRATAERFANEFVSELLRVTTAFQIEYQLPPVSTADQLKDAWEQWRGSAQYPGLIRDLLIVRLEESGFRLYRFDYSLNVLQRIDWPDALGPLRETLLSYHSAAPGTRNARPRQPVFLESIPAVAVPFVSIDQVPSTDPRNPASGQQVQTTAWSAVVLNGDLIVNDLLPRLFESHFAIDGTTPYRIAIVSTDYPDVVKYSSEPMSTDDIQSPDLSLHLLDGGLKSAGPQTVQITAPESPHWRLLIKHRLGSLDAAVDELRQRNIAIGAGILLVLAGSVVMVVVASGRARQMARMQMELAAAISHELRTPLAVIRAAAYNLKEDVIKDPQEVQHYAGMVQDAGRQLSEMVDQTLLFADTQSDRRKITLTSVSPGEVVDRAVRAIKAMHGEGGPYIIKQIDLGLPYVKADPVALNHCVQNLLSNALKYGSSNDLPVTISVSAVERHGEVQISIADCGGGISSEDLPHIFKPFYRAKSVTTETTGTGLGLALVERLMRRQGGKVSVDTEVSVGTTFTLHLPIVHAQ